MSEQDFGESSLVEHLVELRGRLVRALLGLGVVLLALLPFTQKPYNALAEPLVSQLPNGQTMIATNPAGAFFAPLKLTFFVALFVAVPWLLYQLWAFVAPDYAREKCWRCRCWCHRCCCSTPVAPLRISWCCRRCSTSSPHLQPGRDRNHTGCECLSGLRAGAIFFAFGGSFNCRWRW